jgi:hypothetical protein
MDGSLHQIMETQAKVLSKVFSRKIELPEKEVMAKEVVEWEQMMKTRVVKEHEERTTKKATTEFSEIGQLLDILQHNPQHEPHKQHHQQQQNRHHEQQQQLTNVNDINFYGPMFVKHLHYIPDLEKLLNNITSKQVHH